MPEMASMEATMPIKMLLAVGLIAATTSACTAYYGSGYPSTAYNGYSYRSSYYYPGYTYRPAYYYSPQVAYVYP
jgi:hypothetical protein